MSDTHSTSNGTDTKFDSDHQRNDELAGPRDVRSVQLIQDWLIVNLAEILGVDINEIDVQAPFTDYGLGSLQALEMSGDLESWLGLKLDPTILWDYPDIQKLSHHLAKEFEATLRQMSDEEVNTYLQNMTFGKETE